MLYGFIGVGGNRNLDGWRTREGALMTVASMVISIKAFSRIEAEEKLSTGYI